MNQRFFLLCLAAVLACAPLAPASVYARDGNEGGGESEQNEESRGESEASREENGNSDASSADKENPGSDKAEPGSDNGASNAEKDKDDKGSDKGVAGLGNGARDNARAPKDQDHARRAVEANEAIPLKDMLEIFKHYGELTVVDVALVERQDLLAYRIKFIDLEGRVRQAHFDAQTGEQIR
jgi:uncharacterized membrane protein YkoI